MVSTDAETGITFHWLHFSHVYPWSVGDDHDLLYMKHNALLWYTKWWQTCMCEMWVNTCTRKSPPPSPSKIHPPCCRPILPHKTAMLRSKWRTCTCIAASSALMVSLSRRSCSSVRRSRTRSQFGQSCGKGTCSCPIVLTSECHVHSGPALSPEKSSVITIKMWLLTLTHHCSPALRSEKYHFSP